MTDDTIKQQMAKSNGEVKIVKVPAVKDYRKRLL